MCITNAKTADGFLLAGIDVEIAATIEEAHGVIIELLEEDEAGIIALDERLADAVDERLFRRFEKSYRPVLVMLPLGDQANMKRLSQLRLQRLIRRAVGFDVTLKRG